MNPLSENKIKRITSRAVCCACTICCSWGCNIFCCWATSICWSCWGDILFWAAAAIVNMEGVPFTKGFKVSGELVPATEVRCLRFEAPDMVCAVEYFAFTWEDVSPWNSWLTDLNGVKHHYPHYITIESAPMFFCSFHHTENLLNILSKRLAAFPYNHHQNKGQQWERIGSWHNDYNESWEWNWPSLGSNQQPPFLNFWMHLMDSLPNNKLLYQSKWKTLWQTTKYKCD